MDRTTLLVGDKFAEFAELDGVTTVSRLATMLDEPAVGDHVLPQQVVVGQGVSHDWLTYLERRRDDHGVPMAFVGGRRRVERTGKRFCHKYRRENILLSDPEELSEGRYLLALLIDDECELMADHTTGMHIQGMIFTEAARQAFLVVTEWFLVPRTDSYYFVINELATTYHRFAFPVPTEVLLQLHRIERKREDRVAATVTVQFLQNDQLVCEAHIEYAALLQSSLTLKERAMAQTALERSMATLEPAPQAPELDPA